MNRQENLPICTACGTLYESQRVDKHCPICDDPRQFIPPSGQSFTTLAALRTTHRNTFARDPHDARVWSISTAPKFGVGQRAILLETPHGNVLWDCVALLDQETVDFIGSRGIGGGLQAIVISHPHFYTTNAVWADVFGCPVYVASDDEEWLFSRPRGRGEGGGGGDGAGESRLLEDVQTVIVPGATAIKCGGHFPGLLCLHWEKMLFTSDTILTVASGYNPQEHYAPGRTSTYSFMWAIPNMMPLDPKTIKQILDRLEPFDFEVTLGNIPGMDLRQEDVKRRVLESAKIQVRSMGWAGKEEGDVILQENWRWI